MVVVGPTTTNSKAPGLLVVIEDLHWADASTRELLDCLTRRLRLARILVLVTVDVTCTLTAPFFSESSLTILQGFAHGSTIFNITLCTGVQRIPVTVLADPSGAPFQGGSASASGNFFIFQNNGPFDSGSASAQITLKRRAQLRRMAKRDGDMAPRRLPSYKKLALMLADDPISGVFGLALARSNRTDVAAPHFDAAEVIGTWLLSCTRLGQGPWSTSHDQRKRCTTHSRLSRPAHRPWSVRQAWSATRSNKLETARKGKVSAG